MSQHPTQEDLASIRRCVEWAVPQLNCGNMNKDGYWDYLVMMFARVSPDEFTRVMTERAIKAESRVQHLEYFRSKSQGSFP